MILPSIHALITDMEVRYRQSGLGRIDPATDEDYELIMIHKDLLNHLMSSVRILFAKRDMADTVVPSILTDDIKWCFANNAKELIRDIYANIILLDAHYSIVVQKQLL